VACVDPSADCESIANTLKLNAATAFPSGRARSTRHAQQGARRARQEGARRARRAAEREDAEGAGGGREAAVVGVQERVVDAVEGRRLAGRRRANQELRRALKQTGDAYGKLAAAASSGNKRAYAKATRKVQTSEAGRRPRAADDPGRGLQDRGRVSGFTPPGLPEPISARYT
jgi:hypothetical protein